MSNSGLTKYQDELLEILVEECGEIIQEKSKIIRFGIDEDSHHIIGQTHRQCLEQELGDMLGMIQLLVDSGIGITYNGLQEAADRKKKKVVKWMNHKKPETNPAIMSVADVMNMAHDMASEQLSSYKDKK